MRFRDRREWMRALERAADLVQLPRRSSGLHTFEEAAAVEAST
jgi:hypothetical protein